MTAKILIGDCRKTLKELPDKSVHCVVTSPPYWSLRSYYLKEWRGGDPDCKHKGSPACEICDAVEHDLPGGIGLEPTFEEHLKNMVEVFDEVWRVLRDDGTVWLNYGDAYAGSSNPMNLKPKNLMLMPARIAIALQDAGWYVRSEIVWFKPNPLPESVKDRPVSAHEKIFLLSKKPRYYYDPIAVRSPVKQSTIDRVMQESFDEQTGGPKDSKTGNRSHRKTLENIRKRFPTKEVNGFRDREFWDNNDIGANLRNVWHIATQAFKGVHFATFPFKLVEPCIKAGTSRKGVCGDCGTPLKRIIESARGGSVGKSWHDHIADDVTGQSIDKNRTKDYQPPKSVGWEFDCQCTEKSIARPVVLDPFGGSGTVAIVADYLDCDSVICEFSPEYAKMAQDRIIQHMPPLFASSHIVTYHKITVDSLDPKWWKASLTNKEDKNK